MAKWKIILCLLSVILIYPSCDILPFDSSNSPQKEFYYIPKSNTALDTIELDTIKSWEGTQSQDIEFNATKAPWVINSGYTRTSQLSGIFELYIGQSTEIPGVEIIIYNTATLSNGGVIGLIEDSGNFVIHIKASGIKWWVKIGVE